MNSDMTPMIVRSIVKGTRMMSMETKMEKEVATKTRVKKVG